MRRSLLALLFVVAAVSLVVPVLAQGGPPPGAPQGGPGMGPGGPPMMPGMGGGMMSAPPVVVVTDKYVFVAWMGTLSQYSVDGLTLVKSVPLPLPSRGPGMPGGGPGMPPPPPPGGAAQ